MSYDPDVVIESLARPAARKSLDEVTITSSSNVFYQELDSHSPGVCVEHDDGVLSWSPLNISRGFVKAVDADPSDSDLDPDEYLLVDYQMRDGVPGLLMFRMMMIHGFLLLIGHMRDQRRSHTIICSSVWCSLFNTLYVCVSV